jgi:hypothetical protein
VFDGIKPVEFRLVLFRRTANFRHIRGDGVRSAC